jgi:hypothetical protein
MLEVYLQKYNGEFIGDFVQSSYEGFKELGYTNINYFEEFNQIPNNPNSILVGSVESTIHFFKNVGINPPDVLNIPNELVSYLGRAINILDMGTFRKSYKLPTFIKPYDKVKFFPSGVASKKSTIDFLLQDIPDNFKILTSEVVDMISEYRCFINRGKLVGMKHYLGDFKVFPNVNIIEECISSYSNPPISYTMDFAITDKNQTILIEINDAWSIGSYGLDPIIYTKLLIDRWIQILQK